MPRILLSWSEEDSGRGSMAIPDRGEDMKKMRDEGDEDVRRRGATEEVKSN